MNKKHDNASTYNKFNENVLIETNQSDYDGESLSSSDDSSMSEHKNSPTRKRNAGMEVVASIDHETENSSSTYSEKDRHVRMKQKQRDVNKEENSDDDNSSKDLEIRQLERKRLCGEKERRVRMKIDALYESIYVNQIFKDEERSVHRELR